MKEIPGLYFCPRTFFIKWPRFCSDARTPAIKTISRSKGAQFGLQLFLSLLFPELAAIIIMLWSNRAPLQRCSPTAKRKSFGGSNAEGNAPRKSGSEPQERKKEKYRESRAANEHNYHLFFLFQEGSVITLTRFAEYSSTAAGCGASAVGSWLAQTRKARARSGLMSTDRTRASTRPPQNTASTSQ